MKYTHDINRNQAVCKWIDAELSASTSPKLNEQIKYIMKKKVVSIHCATPK